MRAFRIHWCGKCMSAHTHNQQTLEFQFINCTYAIMCWANRSSAEFFFSIVAIEHEKLQCAWLIFTSLWAIFIDSICFWFFIWFFSESMAFAEKKIRKFMLQRAVQENGMETQAITFLRKHFKFGPHQTINFVNENLF